VAATRRPTAVGGQDDALGVRLQNGLNPMARNLRIEQDRRATQLSQAEHRYFWQDGQ
jgi:hypothetical protein